MKLSHVDESGHARMVDVSGKQPVRRTAVAKGTVYLKPETVSLIRDNNIAKGDVLATARIAGIQAAKRTWDLVPLCHQIQLDAVHIDFDVHDNRIYIAATASCTDRTGVEMEAITAVSISGVAIYDMCKAVDDSITISEIHLVKKEKGRIE